MSKSPEGGGGNEDQEKEAKRDAESGKKKEKLEDQVGEIARRGGFELLGRRESQAPEGYKWTKVEEISSGEKVLWGSVPSEVVSAEERGDSICITFKHPVEGKEAVHDYKKGRELLIQI